MLAPRTRGAAAVSTGEVGGVGLEIDI
jgi:hypothetical protein